jgi:hypothetical protein
LFLGSNVTLCVQYLMTHHSLKIQPLPNFVSIRFSKKFPKNLAQRRRVCLHFRPFWEFRPFYVAYKSCDGREPQLPKKALKIQTVLIYLDNIKLHERERERAGGRAAIPLFRGYVSTLSFMVHTDLFRLQILLLFILIGKACAWICSGSRNSGSKSVLGHVWPPWTSLLVVMAGVWWVAQQQRSAPVEKSVINMI